MNFTSIKLLFKKTVNRLILVKLWREELWKGAGNEVFLFRYVMLNYLNFPTINMYYFYIKFLVDWGYLCGRVIVNFCFYLYTFLHEEIKTYKIK